jgi:hypothetical protein
MKVSYENFSPDQEGKIGEDFKRMTEMAPKTVSDGTPYAIWFGAADRVRLLDNLRKMLTVIGDPTRSVKFVNRAGGVLKVEYKALLAPTLMPAGSAGSPHTDGKGSGAIAYAFPVNRMNDVAGAQKIKDLDPLETSSHVGSGMRIYLTEIYFKQTDRARSATLYHDITHKVLATEDICYESGPCQALAADPRRALRNADSYAMLLLNSWRS